MKILISFLLFTTIIVNSQNSTKEKSTKKYLEDQLYAGITYNLLTNKPEGIDLRGFSNTITIGYIRDIPFNEERNLGIGIGLGYAKSTYFNNMKIIDHGNITSFDYFADVDDFDSNKLVFHTLDLPFEFRFRRSTYKKNHFFRFYTGVKLSYVFAHKTEYNLNGARKYTNFDNFNKFQYGLTASIGHGTWNGYFYYGLTNIFDKAIFNSNEELNIKSVRFGLIFYIL